jgi:hypothetical protein
MKSKRQQTYLDRQIQRVVKNGMMGDCPGAGKPLELDNDHYTPSELRLAHKILRDNDLAPDWIMQGKALDEACEKWFAQVRRDALAYQRRRNADAISRFRAETHWHSVLEHHREIATELNKQITTYNLKVPFGIKQKFQLDLEHEIEQILDETTG